VFKRINGVWKQSGTKLVGTGSSGTSTQGTSVSLNADGNVLVVGASTDGDYKGAAWGFTKSGGVWKQFGNKLTGSDSDTTSQFGFSAAVSGDGTTAVFGGVGDSSNIGAAWVYFYPTTHEPSAAPSISVKPSKAPSTTHSNNKKSSDSLAIGLGVGLGLGVLLLILLLCCYCRRDKDESGMKLWVGTDSHNPVASSETETNNIHVESGAL
jgi:hypothetical protein